MAVEALIVAVCLLFWYVFVSESHCEVAGATSNGSSADVFGFFRLKDALDLIDYLITCFQKACCSGVKIFM